MVLFSRSFIRKRAIALATTASVAATSFALAQDPPRMHHVHGETPLQYMFGGAAFLVGEQSRHG
jgi:hypothetical protein